VVMILVVGWEAGYGRFILQHKRPVGNLEDFTAACKEDRLRAVWWGLRRHLEQHHASSHQNAQTRCV